MFSGAKAREYSEWMSKYRIRTLQEKGRGFHRVSGGKSVCTCVRAHVCMHTCTCVCTRAHACASAPGLQGMGITAFSNRVLPSSVLRSCVEFRSV